MTWLPSFLLFPLVWNTFHFKYSLIENRKMKPITTETNVYPLRFGSISYSFSSYRTLIPTIKLHILCHYVLLLCLHRLTILSGYRSLSYLCMSMSNRIPWHSCIQKKVQNTWPKQKIKFFGFCYRMVQNKSRVLAFLEVPYSFELLVPFPSRHRYWNTKWSKNRSYYRVLNFFVRGDWGLKLGLHPYKAGTLPLKPYIQSILLWLFWRWGLQTICWGVPWTMILPISAS
jgi:hypothetical protein